MRRFVIGRLAMVVPVMLGATLVVFILTRLAPGDPTATLLGLNASDAERNALRAQLGLSHPVWVQYFDWLKLVVQGNLGTSIQLQTPVLGVVAKRLVDTLVLAVPAGAVAILAGVGLGTFAATRQNRLGDRVATAFSLFFVSMPPYWLSIVAIYIFAVRLSWFPTGQMHSVTGSQGLSDLVSHLVLPGLVAAAAPLTIIARSTRSAVLEVAGADFLTALRAQGQSERSILWRHHVRNALPQIIAMCGLQFAYLLLGSALFVEIVFNWPGIGLATYNAVETRDLPLIAGIVLVGSAIFTLINLAVDLITAVTDPRLRHV
jgi:peptide/nickel transport system permease protein